MRLIVWLFGRKWKKKDDEVEIPSGFIYNNHKITPVKDNTKKIKT